MASWRHLIGENGRLARHPQGRHECVFVRFTAEEIRLVNRRASEFGISTNALLHLAGRFFVPPPSAPSRFRGSGGRSRARDRALAAELARLAPVLRGVGRNHNQLTAAANAAGAVLPEQMEAFAAQAQRQLQRLDAVIELLDPARKGR